METINSDDPGTSYFAARRLWRYWRGRNPGRGEADAVEAYATGVAMFVIAWAFVVHLTLGDEFSFRNVFLAIVLLPLTWLCWTALLYPHSLLLEGARRMGLVLNNRPRHGQSVLYCLGTSILAAELLVSECGPMQLLGLVWLIAIALNLGAALILVVLLSSSQASE